MTTRLILSSLSGPCHERRGEGEGTATSSRTSPSWASPAATAAPGPRRPN